MARLQQVTNVPPGGLTSGLGYDIVGYGRESPIATTQEYYTMTTLNYSILDHRTGDVIATAEIECALSAPRSYKLRCAALWAVANDVPLEYADSWGPTYSTRVFRG